MMHRIARTMLCFIAIAALTACSKDDADSKVSKDLPACPVGVMTVDGQQVEFKTALGFSEQGSYTLQLYNHQDIDCGTILEKKPRALSEGEVDLRLSASFGGVVASGSEHTMGVTVRLDSKPSEAGEEISICLPEQVKIGENITVVGRFTGQYCGSVK